MTIIPLGAALLTRSSDLPGGCGDQLNPPERTGPARNHGLGLAADSLPIWSCSVWGLPCPRLYSRGGALLPHLFTLTLVLSEPGRYLLCGTSRLQALTPESRTLSGTLSCGVRTFLPRNAKHSGSDRLATLLSLILRQRGYARPGSWRFIQHRHILRRGSDKYAPSRPGRIVLKISGDHPCACRSLPGRENTHHPDLAMDAASNPSSGKRNAPSTRNSSHAGGKPIARIWNTERLACIPLRWKGSPRFGCSPLE